MRMRIAHLISACILDRIRDSSGAGSWRPGRLELIVAVTVFLHERDRACMVEVVEDQKENNEYEQFTMVCPIIASRHGSAPL